MKPKTCIVAGADFGIGKAVATALARRGHRVVLACREPEGAEATQLDLARRGSIHAFTDRMHRELSELDVLIINHAADFDHSHTEREITRDGFETTWATNHLGPVLVVDRLMDLLIASPQGRIVNISSDGLWMHPFLTVDLKDPMFGKRPYSASKSYYQSKLAQLMFIRWLAGRLPGTMITANCVRIGSLPGNPGVPSWLERIRTVKARFAPSPEQMAETCVRAALDKNLQRISGRQFTHPLKEIGIPAYAKDLLCIEQVMQLTYRQLGIQPAISFEPGEEI